MNDKTFKPLSELRKLRFAELLIFLMVKKKCSQTFPVHFLFLEKESQSYAFQHFFRKRKEKFGLAEKPTKEHQQKRV